MGVGKLTPLTTPTPLNRQSRNITHVIKSTISPHVPNLVKIAPAVTSPHIAKVTTHFLPAIRSLLLLFCSLFCQRFLDNPRANSRQILHAGVLWFRLSSPLLGVGGPRRAEKGGNEIFVTMGVNGDFCISAVFERYLSNACTDPHQISFM